MGCLRFGFFFFFFLSPRQSPNIGLGRIKNFELYASLGFTGCREIQNSLFLFLFLWILQQPIEALFRIKVAPFIA